MVPQKRKLVVFTGAGISADSGLLTFRDQNGLWENHSVDKVATLHTFKDNFDLVHRFYNERRLQLRDAQPNPAHYMLAEWQQKYGANIITQNVDDLLERAGCANVNHVHGSLLKMMCRACGHHWDIGYEAWDPTAQSCPKLRGQKEIQCGSKKGVKPGVVFFGEDAPGYSQMWKDLYELREGDMLVVMGTSGEVINIGSHANTLRNGFRVRTVVSNLESAPPGLMDDTMFDIACHGRASEKVASLNKIVQDYFS